MARLRVGRRAEVELLSPSTDAVMAASAMKPAMKTNAQTLDAFIARKAGIDAMPGRLAAR
jgi:hypothetical protein